MKRLSILLMLLFLTGCAASPIETSEPTLPTPMIEAPQPDPTETTVPATTTPPDPIQELLDSMTIEERVGQLFLARCNAESALTDIQAYYLGGFVLFGEDFEFPFTFTNSPSSPANGPLITRIFSPGANGDVLMLIVSSE